MAKPILHYALVKAFAYSSGFDVIGVTSEAHRQVYGRSLVNEVVTHVRDCDVIYRFPDGTTPEFALAARGRADKERSRHQAAIDQARQRVKNLEGHRDMCVLDAAKGLSEAAAGSPPANFVCHLAGGCECRKITDDIAVLDNCDHWRPA